MTRTLIRRAAIISVLAPLTQAALNPARDFGPRGGWFTVYILAPTLGAIIGGGIYKALSTLMPKAGGDSPDEAPD